MTGSVASVLVTVVDVLFQFAFWAILARVILSWLPMAGVQISQDNPVINFLNQVTDPILEPLRRFTTFGMMDFSPIVAMLLLQVVRNVLMTLLGGR